MARLTPLIDPLLNKVLQDKTLMFQAVELHNGPVHIIFPYRMDKNFAELRETLNKAGVDGKIFFAHKPTKSPAFVKQALKNGVGIDVASKGELISALSNGFTGDKIECTGPKNLAFIWLAMRHGCLMSVDSIYELEQISLLLERDQAPKTVRVLLRVSDPTPNDRHFIGKQSRFGIARQELSSAYVLIKSQPRIRMEGFHFHKDETNPEVKSGFVEDILSLMQECYANRFSPTIINIGGGLRSSGFQDPVEGKKFIGEIESAIMEGRQTGTWRESAYGLHVNEKGRVAGREKIEARFAVPDFHATLVSMFEKPTASGRKLADILKESSFSIMLEPGYLMLDQCGATLVKVIGTKKSSNGENLLTLNCNIYNLSTQMRVVLTDPMLISKKDDGNEFSCYMLGNLCKEDDIIMTRKVTFASTPKPGDVICFTNTAAYSSDFEEASPHLHPTGRRFVVPEEPAGPRLLAEENYNPWH